MAVACLFCQRDLQHLMSHLLTPLQKPLTASSMHAPESFKLMKNRESSVIYLQFSVEMEIQCPWKLQHFTSVQLRNWRQKFIPSFLTLLIFSLKLYNC